MMPLRWKTVLKALAPPLLSAFGSRLCNRWREAQSRSAPKPCAWEYVPEGWQRANNDRSIKGWNVPSVARAYERNWPLFRERLQGTGPLNISPEDPGAEPDNVIFHNIIMTFAYVLTLAARNRACLSLLDWGGGLGHYYLLAKVLVPDLEIRYTCREVEELAGAGRRCHSDGVFVSDNACLQNKYDLVLASGSLQFSPDWQRTLHLLAQAALSFLFVTSVPIIATKPSFVFVQRPYAFGYDTEYLAWCFNRQEFLSTAQNTGLLLVREFLVGHKPVIHGAPEQNEYRGFLFQAGRCTGGTLS